MWVSMRCGRRTLLLLVMCSAVLPARAEDLRRRGLLGVQLAPLPDAEREKLALTGGAILVQGTMPGMPAEAAGLKSGDIVIRIGGEPFADMPAGLSLLRRYYAGDELKLGLLRDGQAADAALTLAERPRETSEEFDILYEAAGVDGQRVRLIITKPKAEGRYPVVVLLPSLHPMSLEFAQPALAQHPYKQLTSRLTAAGFVTVRVERPGNGDSEGADPQRPNLPADMAAYAASLARVRELPYADGARVYVFAHSMGSMLAPALAAKDQVAGIVTFGAVGRPLADSVLASMRARWKLELLEEDEIKKRDEALSYFFKGLLEEGKTPEALLQAKPEVAEATEGLIQNGFVMGSHYSYWQELAKLDVAAAWKKVAVPVLVLWGEADYMADRSDSATVAAAVNEGHPDRATLVTIPRCDHNFGTAEDAEESFLAGFGGNFNGAVVEKTAAWINGRNQG